MRDGISIESLPDCIHISRAWIQLEEPVHLGQPHLVIVHNRTNQLGGINARVQAKQDWSFGSLGRQTLRNRDDALKVEVTLLGRLLHPWTQYKSKAKAVATQIRHQRALPINAGIGAPHNLFDNSAVVQGKGIDIRRQPVAEQYAEIRSVACKQELNYLGAKVKQIGCTRIHALTRRRVRWQHANAKRGLIEGVASVSLDGIEVTPGLYQQSHVTANEFCASHTTLDEQDGVDLVEDRFDGRKVVPNEVHASNGSEVIVELFDDYLTHAAQGIEERFEYPKLTRPTSDALTRECMPNSSFTSRTCSSVTSMLSLIQDLS